MMKSKIFIFILSALVLAAAGPEGGDIPNANVSGAGYTAANEAAARIGATANEAAALINAATDEAALINAVTDEAAAQIGAPVESDIPVRLPREEFESLLNRNKDVIGRISIEGTKIDYPVLYDGAHYYLNHDIDHNKVTAGSIYLDPSNNPERDDLHYLIHGHNMKNGTMFKDIVKYKNESFFYKNRLIRFDTLYDDMVWEVFSVYVLDAAKETIFTDYMGSETLYLLFLEKYAEKSMYAVEGIEFTADDRILTLSTCSYETPNSRTIVHARLIYKNGVQAIAPTINLR